jgi:peptidoglycan/xylan/chitin deacetylase (PgdA/CDA1 family)
MLLDAFDRAATVYFFHPLRHLWVRDERVRIPILMYHSISDDPEERNHPYYWTTTSPKIFARHMQCLAESGYSVLALEDAVRRIESNTPSQKREMVITFDDGFRDFYTDAFPILARYGFAASVFLPTDYIGDDSLRFNGKKCLDWSQVQELQRAGISFGSHTMSHPKLQLLDAKAQSREVHRSREILEEQLGRPINSFAYPYAFPECDGSFTRQFREILQGAGYKHGVSTVLGLASAADDRFFLRRLPASSRDDSDFLQAKLEGGYDWLHSVQYAAKLIKERMRKGS